MYMMFQAHKYKIIISGILGLVLICVFSYYFFAPPTFESDTIVEIPADRGSYSIAKHLANQGLVRSPTMLHLAIVLTGSETHVQAGSYLFEKPLSVYGVAKRISRGIYGFIPRKITLPEGISSREMSEILADNLIGFDAEAFVEKAEDKEGYLFPDTYLFMPLATTPLVIDKLTTTFETRIKEVSQEIGAFNKPLSDIITMASIVEEEANDKESRRIVAGILWKRLEIGMPLQVDATFRFINNKTSAELTVADLKLDSPYNTYKYKGLPPSPISNPGIESIRDTVTPIDTPYLYFLTGDDGKMYYAKSLDEHNINKSKYIKD